LELFYLLPKLKDAESRSITPENPTGEKGKGAMAMPEEGSPASKLGRGWKVRPCITLPKGDVVKLAEIEGSGFIRHIWITVDAKAYRDCILRILWDDEENPSVEVPLGDFFVNCHGLRYNVNSIPIAVNPSGGFNCYFPMPFRRRAVITIENQHTSDIPGFFYAINYSLEKVDGDLAYFHAQWRRSMTTRENPQHVILDNVKGRGHYVGTVLAWTQLSNGWWGEGEVKFYIDGDAEFPTICSTGTEDYFGGAWGFGETFCGPFLGYPLWRKEPGEVPRHALYRWHILDPVVFKRDLKVTVQALGWYPNGKFQPLTDDIASVAYWYQTEPHVKFPELPPVEGRWSR
jgi:hypothetical protein